MLDSILQIFESFGFPIACCIFLGYYLNKLSTEYKEDLKKLTGEYKEAINQFQKALDKNTNVLQKLSQKLEKKGAAEDGE